MQWQRECPGILSDKLLDLGFLALADGDNRTYQTACQTLLDHFPKEGAFLGWICHAGPHALRDYSPLLTLLKTEVKQHPESRDTLLQLGAIQYEAGEWAEALQTLTHHLPADAPNADYWFILAMAHSRAGHVNEAREAFDTGVQCMARGAFQGDAWSEQWKVRVTWQAQLHEAAEALKIPPTALTAIDRKLDLLREAHRYESLQQWPQAITALTTLLRDEPENVQFHLWRGSAYMQTKQMPEALADFKYHLIPALPPGNLPKSQASQAAAVILFYNNTASVVKLFWIGFDGKPVAYGTIPPKAIFPEAGTFVTHVWLITDTNDKPIAGYIVPSGGGLAPIEPTNSRAPQH